MKTMNDLFLHFLQDIYYAEKAFAKTSGKIMKAVGNEEVLPQFPCYRYAVMRRAGREHGGAETRRGHTWSVSAS
jgi:ferritin-like metal-binding protein YciE